MSCYACGDSGGPMFLRQFADRRNADWICQRCAEDLDAGTDPRVPPDRAPLAIVRAPETLAIGRPLSSVESELLSILRHPSPENPIEEPIEEDAVRELAAICRALDQAGVSVPRARDARARKQIGEAIARHLCNARDGETADQAARRVVAALGPDEALAASDVLVKWGMALAAYADRAASGGMRRG